MAFEAFSLYTPQQQAADKFLRALAESESACPVGDALTALVQKELENCELGDDVLSLVTAAQKQAAPPLHLQKF